MAVALTGLRLPASKGTGLPFGSPASTTIDFGAKRYVWLCDGMTQKKDAFGVCVAFDIIRGLNPGTRFNEVPDKHKPKMPQGARGQVQCNIGS
ncbi:hypothetical protein AUP84_23355 [Escherichia coli]|nr:hypothetical protein [Escherichia coli]EIM3109828.1 hypothetical protein [Escherichia coli]KXP59889.1 hypothetical protein AUP84_23355 [Escherichia coli]OWE11652.1 hypothetical protein A8M43_24645 [Escherichia coli]HAM4528319.1 hypothetical protein [Escherichia coli]